MSWKIKAYDQKLIVYCREINRTVEYQREQGEKVITEVKGGF